MSDLEELGRLTKAKPVQEKFNVDEKVDVPLYMRRSAYGNYKGLEETKLQDVENSDKIIKNKTDYTQRGEK